MKIVRSKRILVGETWAAADILVRQGKIAAIEPWGSLQSAHGGQIMDLGEQVLLPGLIDTHIHGYAGCDTMDATPQALLTMAKELLKAGVTSFYPTTMTAARKDVEAALLCAAGLLRQETGGARVCGVFAEGPFISTEHRGAQPLEAIEPIDLAWVNTLCEKAPGVLKKMILAPELFGAPQAVQWLAVHGIQAALGHSSAQYNETVECIRAGAGIAVHTFNGMRGLHHREPGLLGAVLTQDSIMAELICDGIHVHPAAMTTLLRCKGPSHVVLISDCMRAGGMPDGKYMLGDTKTTVCDGIARTETGALAGSTLKLIDAVKNAVELLNLPLEQAVEMASANPARAMGIFGEAGSICVGKRADLIAVHSDYTVTLAMVGGAVCHCLPGAVSF